jgi:hypothetical protein
MKTRTFIALLSYFTRVSAILFLFSALVSVVQAQTTNLTVPVVTIRAADADATWQGDPGFFVVTRHGPTNASLSLYYTIGGTATNGIDYAAIANWIVIPAGIHSNIIQILPKDLRQVDRRDVVLTLTYPPTMPPINYVIGSPSNAVVYIHPAMPPQTVVTVHSPDSRAAEPGTSTPGDPGLFTFHRMGPTNFALPVYFRLGGTAANGVDYAEITNVVVIPTGEVDVDVVVKPLGDNLAEGQESVVAQVVPPACIAIFPPPPECYQVGLPSTAELVIADAQQPPTPTNYPPVVRITSPPNGAVFRSPVNIPVFAYACDREEAIASVEFFAGARSLGFGEPVSGRSNVIGTVNATNMFVCVWSNAPVGSHVLTALATTKGGETGRSGPVNIAVLTSPPPPTNRPALVSIIAKDPIAIEGTNCWVWPGLVDSNLGWRNWPTGTCRLYTNCGPKNATFMVRRQGTTNDPLTVLFHVGGTATNGVDYLPLSGEVTIPAGERAALISVVPIDDSIPERNETVVLRLNPSATSNAAYLVGTPASAAALIVDGDHTTRGGMLSDKSFHLSATGPDGAWFRVEVSSNMVDWTPVTYGQVINGSIDFVDPDTEGAASRFYRAVPELTVPVE